MLNPFLRCVEILLVVVQRPVPEASWFTYAGFLLPHQHIAYMSVACICSNKKLFLGLGKAKRKAVTCCCFRSPIVYGSSSLIWNCFASLFSSLFLRMVAYREKLSINWRYTSQSPRKNCSPDAVVGYFKAHTATIVFVAICKIWGVIFCTAVYCVSQNGSVLQFQRHSCLLYNV